MITLMNLLLFKISEYLSKLIKKPSAHHNTIELSIMQAKKVVHLLFFFNIYNVLKKK